MAIKYISDLTAVTNISDTDVLVIDDGEHNYKIAWSVLKSLLGTISAFTADNEAGTITITTANGATLTITPHDPDKQDKLTFDTTPTENSTNPVTSGGIKAALDEKLDENDYKLFTGATESTVGTPGIVPAPGSEGMYLGSEGTWQAPDDTPTQDSEKLVTSGAVHAALERKADNATTLQGYGITDAYSKSETDAKLAGKQSTEAGKGLSSNDYTDEEKQKLACIEAGAEKNVDPDWSSVKNKPTTLAGYGVTDAYTKSETDSKLSNKQNTLTFDSTPTTGSSNPITSGGVKAALDLNAASHLHAWVTDDAICFGDDAQYQEYLQSLSN